MSCDASSRVRFDREAAARRVKCNHESAQSMSQCGYEERWFLDGASGIASEVENGKW